MKVLTQLWRDDLGFIISAELVLVATILVIGMIVGLVSLRGATAMPPSGGGLVEGLLFSLDAVFDELVPLAV